MFLLLSTLTAIVYSVPLVYLWNYAMTSMFGFSEVTIYQMAAFLVLIFEDNHQSQFKNFDYLILPESDPYFLWCFEKPLG